MIRAIRDKRVRQILDGMGPKRFPPDLLRVVQVKLVLLDAAQTLDTLRAPPSNRLEALRGARAGQYLIRINRQWRLCFRRWGGDARGVKIVAYH